MATKLTEFPADAVSRSGYSRYDWTQFLDGGAWELEAGKDFTVGTKSFRSAAAQAAKQKGGKAKTAVMKRTAKQTVPAETEGGEATEVDVTTEFVALQFIPNIPVQVVPETAPETETKPAGRVKK